MTQLLKVLCLIKTSSFILEPSFYHSRIFSTFIYNSESYMIAFQVKYLFPLISKFVVIYSNISFTGKPLGPPRFEPFNDFLDPFFKNGTVFIFLANAKNYNMCSKNFYYDLPENKDNFHRKCIISSHTYPALVSAGIRENDFFYYGDVDEFPTIDCVNFLKKNPPNKYTHILNLYSYSYTFKWYCQIRWLKLVYIRYTKDLKRSDIVDLRYMNYSASPYKDVRMIHMSSNFQHISEFYKKINSYAHKQTFRQFQIKDKCQLYLSIIRFTFFNNCYYQQRSIFPKRIMNDKSISIMFSPFPIIEYYNFFEENCSKFKNTSTFKVFQNKINGSNMNQNMDP